MKKWLLLSLLGLVVSTGFSFSTVAAESAEKTAEAPKVEVKTVDNTTDASKDDNSSSEETDHSSWNDVDYFQIRLEPHWIAQHEVSFEFQFRLGSHFSLGPTLAYMSDGKGIYSGGKSSDRLLTDDKTKRGTVGVRGVFYFKDMNQSSAYIATFIKHANSKITIENEFLSSTDVKSTGEFNENSLGVTAGYQWKWVGFLTFNVGGGLTTYDKPKTVTLTGDDGTSSKYALNDNNLNFILDLGIGFAF